jgi:hypothetical protein
MRYFLLLFSFTLIISSCKRDKTEETPPVNNTNPGLTASTPVKGYSMLSHIGGIWSGPVSSTTALGSFPEWILDLRAIAGGQVSGKSELDSLNDIFLSFFIVKYNNQYSLAMRNGGGFAGMYRISYLLCDSVYESSTEQYYRFSDFKMGIARAYTEYHFRNDSLYMKTYTNRYNTVNPATLHMEWNAARKDTTYHNGAAVVHGFPQKLLTKDFSSSFSATTESIFYDTTLDPYPEGDQPYLGKATVNITYTASTPGTQSFVIFTTQPLFSGMSFQSSNLKYRSRYVILPVSDQQYTFTYLHPGTYYAYVLNDANGDQTFSSGDHINSPLSVISFTLNPESQVSIPITVGFTIP